MATDATGFKEFFPEFAAVPDTRIDKWLTYVLCLICPSTFGDCADQAVYLLAAHYLSMEQDRIAASGSGGSSSNASGIVASQAVGDVSISFDNTLVNSAVAASPGDVIGAELAGTQYGRMYQALRARQGTWATTTGMFC